MEDGLQKIRDFRNTLTGRVLLNAGWVTAATPITMALGLVQTGLVARMVGLEGIGVLGLFAAIAALLSSLSNTSSAETLLTFASRSFGVGDKNEASRIIVYCHLFDLFTSSLAYGMLLLFFRAIGALFHVPNEDNSLLIVYGLTVILSATYWDSHSLLRIADRFQWTFYQSVVRSSVGTILMALLFWKGGTLVEVVWLNVIIAALDNLSITILGFIALNQMGVGYSMVLHSGTRVPKDVHRFQILGYGRGIIKSINRYADVLLIGYLASPVEVGLYRVSKQLADVLKTPAQGFVSSLYPEYSRLWFAKQVKSLRQLVRRYTFVFAFFGFMAAVALSLFINQVIVLALGVEFLPARDAALIMLLSSIIVVSMTPLYSLPAAVGQGEPAFQAVSVALLTQVVLMWLLVPDFGAVGAAWANVGYVVAWVAALVPSIMRTLRAEPEIIHFEAENKTEKDIA